MTGEVARPVSGRRLAVLAIAVIGLLLAWGVHRYRQRERRWDRAWCFSQAAIGIRHYCNNNEHTMPPPATMDEEGNRLCSWRLVICFYLMEFGREGPRWDTKVGWDDPMNDGALHRSAFYCFSDSDDGSRCFNTGMLAITGPGTVFDDESPRNRYDIPDDTILLLPVRDSGIHWMQPGDFQIDTMPRTINAEDGQGISSDFSDGFHVAFADGTVWFLSNRVPFDELEKFFTVESAAKYDRSQVLGPYLLDAWPPAELLAGGW